MPIIPRIWEKGKMWLQGVPEGALTIAIVVLASGASFGLGMLAERAGKVGDIEIQQLPLSAELPSGKTLSASSVSAAAVLTPEVAAAMPAGGQYVASKKGSKYHLPWCAGAKAMSEENKIWFATKADAEAAGYTPAANCKGI